MPETQNSTPQIPDGGPSKLKEAPKTSSLRRLIDRYKTWLLLSAGFTAGVGTTCVVNNLDIDVNWNEQGVEGKEKVSDDDMGPSSSSTAPATREAQENIDALKTNNSSEAIREAVGGDAEAINAKQKRDAKAWQEKRRKMIEDGTLNKDGSSKRKMNSRPVPGVILK